MVSVEQVKQAARENISVPVVVSVIFAGALMAGTVYALRKVGFNKAASVVAKAK